MTHLTNGDGAVVGWAWWMLMVPAVLGVALYVGVNLSTWLTERQYRQWLRKTHERYEKEHTHP